MADTHTASEHLHDDHHAAHNHPTIGVYVTVFIALLVLLVVTVVVSEMEFGPMNFLVAASIATVKAVLIILFFMHVRYSPRLTWLVAGAGFFFLGILFVLTMADYLTRAFTPFSEQL
jgi:cytochrome c oxidase subunit IV